MLEQLLYLPYTAYWLPLVMAGLIAAVVYVGLTRAMRSTAPAEVVAAAPTDDPFAGGSSSEQRAGYRRTGNPVIILYRPAADHGVCREGAVIDRGVGGLRLMLPETHEIGTVLAIRPADAAEYVPEVQVEVLSCRPSSTRDGEYDLGCQFVKSPTYAMMLMFG